MKPTSCKPAKKEDYYSWASKPRGISNKYMHILHLYLFKFIIVYLSLHASMMKYNLVITSDIRRDNIYLQVVCMLPHIDT